MKLPPTPKAQRIAYYNPRSILMPLLRIEFMRKKKVSQEITIREKEVFPASNTEQKTHFTLRILETAVDKSWL